MNLLTELQEEKFKQEQTSSINNLFTVVGSIFGSGELKKAVADLQANMKNIVDAISSSIPNKFVSESLQESSGWTAETLMKRHQSRPYNPAIANTFFRAGYIESWGRGIQKICDTCKDYGIPLPEYIVHPEDIMLKLNALEVANQQDVKSPKHQWLNKERLSAKEVSAMGIGK